MVIVSQAPMLFNSTVRANLSYGLLDVNEVHVIPAAQAAFQFSFNNEPSDCFVTSIAKNPFPLSRLHCQRLDELLLLL